MALRRTSDDSRREFYAIKIGHTMADTAKRTNEAVNRTIAFARVQGYVHRVQCALPTMPSHGSPTD